MITPPSYRIDLEIDADILEEVARMHGLNQIPNGKTFKSNQWLFNNQTKKEKRSIRHELAAMGLNEIISYSLIPELEVNRYLNVGEKVSVLMPLSEDKKTLRQSLLHGLLQTVNYNQNRQQSDVCLFEMGHVFAKGIEIPLLGIAMSGVWHQSQWQKQGIKADFYVLKGILDKLMAQFGIVLDYKPTSEHTKLHPYRQAHLLYKGKTIGYIGEVHPKEVKALDINATTILEIELMPILNHEDRFEFEAISRYPNISRDLAIVVDEKLRADLLIELIKQTTKKQLVSIHVFDVYSWNAYRTREKNQFAFNLVF